ncbi:MAG: potassium channel family protein [Phycisphaerae bacterium]
MSPRSRLILSVIALIGVFVAGTFGFLLIESDKDVSLLDAVFMTAITLSTVGYHEVWTLSDSGRLWSLVVITFGIATVSVAFTSLIALFVSGELRAHREMLVMDKKLKAARDHVILCGFGRMGSMVVRDLEAAKIPVVVLEADAGRLDELKGLNTRFIIGDATEDDMLLRAGIMRASALISMLPRDADNVFIALTAHALRPDLNIIARAEQPQTEPKLKCAGARRVICPQLIGATRTVDILTRPNVVDFVDVAAEGVQLEMDEYVINTQSTLSGKMLKECQLREQLGATVVAIKRADGKTVFSPDPQTALNTGDTLILVGKAGVSQQLAKFASTSA